MQPATNNRVSYENLTNFLSVYSQLELHNGVDRFDQFLRDKLVPLLLPTHLQYDFLRSCMDKEREYKRSLDSDDLNDSASTSFSMAKGEDFENKRRDHFVSAMKMNAEIVRRIVVCQPHQNITRTKPMLVLSSHHLPLLVPEAHQAISHVVAVDTQQGTQ